MRRDGHWKVDVAGSTKPRPGRKILAISAGSKYGDAESKVGQAVAVGVRNPFDQAVKPEPSQLIGHAAIARP
jgi:hypothetical protein